MNSDVNKGEPKLQERLFIFSVNIILAIRKLPNTPEYRVITYQLIKSSTSTAANYENRKQPFRNQIFVTK